MNMDTYKMELELNQKQFRILKDTFTAAILNCDSLMRVFEDADVVVDELICRKVALIDILLTIEAAYLRMIPCGVGENNPDSPENEND